MRPKLPSPNTNKCLGCGKQFGDYESSYYVYDNKSKRYAVCAGRSDQHPKTECLRKAAVLLYESSSCPGCGKNLFPEGGHLCVECYSDLVVGRGARVEAESSFKELVTHTRDNLIQTFWEDITLWGSSRKRIDSCKEDVHFGDLFKSIVRDKTINKSDGWHTLLLGLHHLIINVKELSYKNGFEDGTSLLRKVNQEQLTFAKLFEDKRIKLSSCDRKITESENYPSEIEGALYRLGLLSKDKKEEAINEVDDDDDDEVDNIEDEFEEEE